MNPWSCKAQTLDRIHPNNMNNQIVPCVITDYGRFLNKDAQRRKEDPLSALFDLSVNGPANTIDVAGGSTHPEHFPIKKISVTLGDGSVLAMEPDLVKRSLQYSPSAGLPETIKLFRKMVEKFHDPPTMKIPVQNGGLKVIAIKGCTEGFSKTFEMVMNSGDNILMGEPGFTAVVTALLARGINIIPIKKDKDGIVPESLKMRLSKWKPEDALNPASDIPKLLFVNPCGSNPNGSTAPLDRRLEVYKLAQKYNLLIVEDDPYYFINFQKDRVPSYLSLDVDGRVIRCDSFSKVLSPGLRIGMMSGPQPLVQKMMYHIVSSSMTTSTLSQTLINEIFKKWGFEKFIQHTEELSEFYKSQRDACVRSAEKWLTGLAEWDVPAGGFFLWLRLKGVEDSNIILRELISQGALFVPGCACLTDPERPTPDVRVSFSYANPEEIDKAIEMLSTLLKSKTEKEGNKNIIV